MGTLFGADSKDSSGATVVRVVGFKNGDAVTQRLVVVDGSKIPESEPDVWGDLKMAYAGYNCSILNDFYASNSNGFTHTARIFSTKQDKKTKRSEKRIKGKEEKEEKKNFVMEYVPKYGATTKFYLHPMDGCRDTKLLETWN